MNLKEIREAAKKKLQGYCQVCPECNGKACRGEVPGMGGIGRGFSFQANTQALEAYRLNLRTIHSHKNPSTAVELFGCQLKSPLLAAPITGTTYNMGEAIGEKDYAQNIVAGAQGAGTLAMTGDGADPGMYGSGVASIKEAGGWGIPIIKPREQEEILKRIKQAEEAGAKGVGIDIDGAGLVTMALKGQPVGPKSKEELRELIAATSLPFILKGIMTVDEAKIAVEIGAAAIVVSNHGGRVLDAAPGVAEVLPEISEAVNGKITILADGGVRTGLDALKYLALGADGVLIGRPLVIGAVGGGTEGVKLTLENMAEELRQAMILTGCGNILDIDERIIF